MRSILLLAPLFLLTACGVDVEAACTAYVDAAGVCAGEYAESLGGDAADYELPASTCDAYAGSKDGDSADYLNCLADIYAAGDCTTAEGYTAVATDLASCTLGG